jgi:hypothetical protein
MAKLKKAFGRQISNWKAQAAAANPGASDQDLANIVNDMAKKQGFAYTISPEKVRAKAKPPARKRAAAPKAAAPATSAAPAARRTPASSPRSAEGQLMSDLRSFVQLLGKDAARSLLDEMVNRV